MLILNSITQKNGTLPFRKMFGLHVSSLFIICWLRMLIAIILPMYHSKISCLMMKMGPLDILILTMFSPALKKADIS